MEYDNTNRGVLFRNDKKETEKRKKNRNIDAVCMHMQSISAKNEKKETGGKKRRWKLREREKKKKKYASSSKEPEDQLFQWLRSAISFCLSFGLLPAVRLTRSVH